MPIKKSAVHRGQKQDADEEAIASAAKPSPTRKAAHSAVDAVSDEIGRARVLKKYWELANLDPEITKGNITGQLKALDSLCDELGFAPAARENEKPASQEIYRSAWMRKDGTRTAAMRSAGKRTNGE